MLKLSMLLSICNLNFIMEIEIYAKELYKDKNVYYIDGSIDVHKREEIRAKFEESDGNLLIA